MLMLATRRAGRSLSLFFQNAFLRDRGGVGGGNGRAGFGRGGLGNWIFDPVGNLLNY